MIKVIRAPLCFKIPSFSSLPSKISLTDAKLKPDVPVRFEGNYQGRTYKTKVMTDLVSKFLWNNQNEKQG